LLFLESLNLGFQRGSFVGFENNSRSGRHNQRRGDAGFLQSGHSDCLGDARGCTTRERCSRNKRGGGNGCGQSDGGGLHGVGISVTNALSERLEVEVAREQILYRMVFERGMPKSKLETVGRASNRRGSFLTVRSCVS